MIQYLDIVEKAFYLKERKIQKILPNQIYREVDVAADNVRIAGFAVVV
jgi:hypothetical protein